MAPFQLLILLLTLLVAPAQARPPTVEVIVELDGPALPKGQAKAELMRLLKTHLGQAEGRLRIKASKGFWASQSLLVRLPASEVQRLAQVPGVRRVYPNRTVQLGQPVAKALSDTVGSGSNWALAHIGAPGLWAAGMRGQGIRIGHLDTGVDAAHPDLRGKIVAFAEVSAGGVARLTKPYDSSLHGTYTAGLLVGNHVGVAPEARLVSALVLPGGYGTLAQVLGGLDWVLEQNVHIVSMSLGLEGTQNEFVPVIERMKQMGVLPVFAIGNSGGAPATPGNMPGVLGIGAIDSANRVAGFSSRGEVRWGDPYNTVVQKPDLVAPGVDVRSSIPGGRYMSMSGTSASTAIAAGGAALLMSGGFKAEQVRQALLNSALPLSATGSGKGAIRLGDALAALKPAPPDSPPAAKPSTPLKTALLVIEAPETAAIQKALETLELSSTVVQASPDKRPGAGEIAQYPLVIWVLPPDWSQRWPEAQRKMLRAYVEQGGRLVLIASYPGQQPLAESSTFGKGRASFVSGDLDSLSLEQRTQALRGVIQQILR